MKTKFPLPPFLFAAAPVLMLLASNISQLHVKDGYRALIVALLVALLVLLIFRAILRDWTAAATLSTALLLLVFTYGHMYNVLKQVDVAGFVLGRHRYLLPLYVVLFGLAVWGVLRFKPTLPRINEALNVIGLLLIGISIYQLASFEIKASRAEPDSQANLASVYGVSRPESGTPPDVYYIILDGYARDDQLMLQLGFDNTPFMQDLRDLGFYVPECNRSNYTMTQLSLTSVMNFSYLEDLGIGLEPDALLDTAVFDTMVRRDSRVLKIFKELGYSSVAFETGFRWTEIESADYYFSPNQNWLAQIQSGSGLNAFEAIWIRTTIALPLLQEQLVPVDNLFAQDQITSGDRVHYELIKYDFDKLEEVPDLPGQKFVFAHLVIPHEPYVFAADGSFQPTEDIKSGYVNQIQYVNGRLVQALKVILAKSATPPVIMIQADHGGPYLDTPDRIFPTAAYYFPGADEAAIKQVVTPVNLFRFVFDQYFGADLPLLANKSYFSTYYWPYDFTQLGEQRPSCLDGSAQ